jgi:hypothetical protein
MTDSSLPLKPVEIFCAYSHKDEGLRDELETHLSILKRRGLISAWHDRRIAPGMEWDDEISEHLNRADVILLLVSADFIASEYCWNREMTRAMERHQQREARVVPVILRDCDWDFAPFSKLQALPKDGRPVAAWPDKDEAFKNVALGIRSVVEELSRIASTAPRRIPIRLPPSGPTAPDRKYRSPVRDRRDLLLYGPRIKVTFGPPILGRLEAGRRSGSDPTGQGKFLQTDALLDVGAQRTVLTPDAVRMAGLPKISEVSLTSVGGTLRANTFAASLQFPYGGLKPIEVLEVCCFELPSPLFRCLLGRDVLSRWTLTYNGPIGTWEITERGASSWIEPPEGSDLPS